MSGLRNQSSRRMNISLAMLAALSIAAQQPLTEEEFGTESESKPRKPTKAEKKAAKRARHAT